MTTTAATSRLAAFRGEVARALEETAVANDWPVLALPVDALHPPAYLLDWGAPWLERSTVCAYRATLDVVCVSGRVDPDPGLETLELMAEGALLALDLARVAATVATKPGPFELGGVRYLATRLSVVSNLKLGS